MAQTIKRGAKTARRATAAKGTRAKVQTARKKTGSVFDSVMRWLPFGEQTLYRIALGGIFAVGAGVVWVVASAAGVPELAGEKIAQVSSTAGFRFDHVQLRGVQRMNELQVYEQVLGDQQRAWTEVDVAAMRERLMGLPWVKDARVARQLPDTLVIDIVERTPRAVLRKDEKFVLVDDTGAELEAVDARRAKGLLALSGAGAGGRIADLDALLEAAPALKPQVSEAEWVGNRRWNLTFRSGQILALPEGAELSAQALLEFARMDGVNRLLGGKVVYFDMRAGDRTYLRVPGHADAIAAEKSAEAAAKAKAKAAAAAAKPEEE
jgi:cell division protein FtsQ